MAESSLQADEVSVRVGHRHAARAGWTLVRSLVLRGLGLVYAVAFLSLSVQVEGLFGSRGILPVAPWLAAVERNAPDTSWIDVPTIFWLSSGDTALLWACRGGALFGFALTLGLLPRLSALACWVLYLSLFSVGRVFLGFQWDTLLLEGGFLGVLATLSMSGQRRADRGSVGTQDRLTRLVAFLFRYLVFRLMFASGVVKLLSRDSVWWDLTALDYHWWTQPLPACTAWYAAELPGVVSRAGTGVMFFIELIVPLFVFGPRRMRPLVFGLLALLQVAIACTGNYGFFNLLTLVLCLSVLDDDCLRRFYKAARRNRLLRRLTVSIPSVRFRGTPVSFRNATWPESPAILRRLLEGVVVLLAAVLVTTGTAQMMGRLGLREHVPSFATQLTTATRPLRWTSSYGLFARMTRKRPEVELEASMDGRTWLPYVFHYKPGPVDRPSGFVAPHQPRLDWQMWFAALGNYRRNSWIIALQRRLLEAEPAVLELFASAPFGTEKPRHVRAVLYRYRFAAAPGEAWSEGEGDSSVRSSSAEVRKVWWQRERVGLYTPVQSARSPG